MSPNCVFGSVIRGPAMGKAAVGGIEEEQKRNWISSHVLVLSGPLNGLFAV